MKPQIKKICIFVTCYSLLMSALLSATGLATPVEDLNKYISSLNTYQAEFTQTIFGQSGQEIDQASGIVKLQKPGKFYWSYQSPYKQALISDGETLWVHDIDLEQVTVNDVDLINDNSPASILSGNVDINNHYTVSDLGLFDDYRWIELLPIDTERDFSAVKLGFHDDQLAGMVLFDNIGQTTVIQFENINLNVTISPVIFKFELPLGVDVIDMRQHQDTD